MRNKKRLHCAFLLSLKIQLKINGLWPSFWKLTSGCLRVSHFQPFLPPSGGGGQKPTSQSGRRKKHSVTPSGRGVRILYQVQGLGHFCFWLLPLAGFSLRTPGVHWPAILQDTWKKPPAGSPPTKKKFLRLCADMEMRVFICFFGGFCSKNILKWHFWHFVKLEVQKKLALHASHW